MKYVGAAKRNDSASARHIALIKRCGGSLRAATCILRVSSRGCPRNKNRGPLFWQRAQFTNLLE